MITKKIILDRILASVTAVNSLVAAISKIALIAMVMVIVFDSFGRYLFSKPLGWSYEMVGLLMVLVPWTMVATLEQAKGHLRVNILEKSLGRAGVYATDILASALGLIFTGLAAAANYKEALKFTQLREVSFGLVNFPVYPVRWILFVSLVLFAIQFAINILHSVGHIGEIRAERDR